MSTQPRHQRDPASAPAGPGDAGPGDAAGVRRRADAQRSITAILDAALACFASDPDASMTAVARAAGVGRVTLYAHFPSREALLEAAQKRAFAELSAALDAEDLDGVPAREAVARTVRSSWKVLDQHRGLMAASVRHLDPARLRERHDPVLARIERLIARGQDEGVFRTDLPGGWLVAVAYNLSHAAAEEVNAGRLSSAAAAEVLEATLLAALASRGTTLA